MKRLLSSALVVLTLTLVGCGTDPVANSNAATPVSRPTVSQSGACTEELQRCEDGAAVGRNPDNACAFDACPKGHAVASPAPLPQPEVRMCTMDVKMCPDGSAVGRDGANNCAFRPCKS